MLKLEEAAKAIITWSPVGLIPSLVVTTLLFRKLSPDLKIIGIFVYIACLVELLAGIMWYNKMNNLVLLHIYTLVEFGVISWYYHVTLRGFVPAWLVPSAVTAFSLFSLYNSFFIQDLDEFNTYARGLEALLVITYIIMFFYKTFIELKVEYLGKEPAFWIGSGFLLYFSGGLFLFMVSDHLLPSATGPRHLVWAMHAVFTIVFHILISIGLWNRK
jgi:hypothetical protein